MGVVTDLVAEPAQVRRPATKPLARPPIATNRGWPADAADVAALQRLAGNRAVAGMLAARPAAAAPALAVQRKVTDFTPATTVISPPTGQLTTFVEGLQGPQWPFHESPAHVLDVIRKRFAVLSSGPVEVPTSVTATISSPYKKAPKRKSSASGVVGRLGRAEMLLRASSEQAIEGGHLIPHEVWGSTKPEPKQQAGSKKRGPDGDLGGASAKKAKVASAASAASTSAGGSGTTPRDPNMDGYANLVPMSRTFNVTQGWDAFEHKLLAGLDADEAAVFKADITIARGQYSVPLRSVARAFGFTLEREAAGANGAKPAKIQRDDVLGPLDGFLPTQFVANLTKVPAPGAAAPAGIVAPAPGPLRESTIFDTSSKIDTAKTFRHELRRTSLWHRLTPTMRAVIKGLA